MFLEVKNFKNRTPKVILHPNTIFKSHQFVVMFLIHLYIHSSRQTIGPRDTSIRDITKNLWFLKQNFGWKTPFGFRFLKFFTSKNMPSTWWIGGWKNFEIPKSTTLTSFFDSRHNLLLFFRGCDQTNFGLTLLRFSTNPIKRVKCKQNGDSIHVRTVECLSMVTLS